MIQPSVMFVYFMHISLSFGGKGIQTKGTVIFLPLFRRCSCTSMDRGNWCGGFKYGRRGGGFGSKDSVTETGKGDAVSLVLEAPMGPFC